MEISPIPALPARQAAATTNSANSRNSTDSVLSPKLKTAAHEFEASLMRELLKPLERDPLFAPDGADGAGGDQGSSQALMSFGSDALAEAISKHGGFGIATKILDHFRAEANVAPAASSSKNLEFSKAHSGTRY